MKILFKALKNSKDLTRVLNYCENNRIETLHNESSLTLDVIKLEETRGVINWGGYGSSFEIGSNLFNYFKLDYPGGPPPRGKNFTHVKMVMNGILKNNDTEEVIQKVEKLGGLVVQDVDDKVNLMVIGEKSDKQLLKKAEELNQVLILDEERFIQILPAKRKLPVKRQIKPQKVLPQTVDKNVLKNLKKLFTSRENDLINQGHEVLRSLADADVCNYFLDGVKYTPQDDIGLIPNSMFTGTGPAQPYLNYALLGVITCAPEDCEVAVNIRQSIVNLRIVLSSVGPLTELKNLESLDLSGSSSIENLNELVGCTKLTSFTLQNASFTALPADLDEITRLTHLDLAGCQSLQNVDGLVNLVNLTNLNLYNCNIKKVDALVNLTKLSHLNLDDCFYIFVPPKTDIMTTSEEVIEYQDKIRLFMALRDRDTDVLSDYKDVTELDLDNCDSLENVDGLVNFSKLASLKLSGDSLSVSPAENEMGTRKQVAEYQDKIRIFMALRDGNTNLINDYKDSTSIDLSNCESLKNVDVLANCTKLTELNLSSCESLENVDGLAKCTNLAKLDLSHCYSLKNVDGLSKCTKLGNLNLDTCNEIRNLDGLKNCTNLTNLNLSGCYETRNLDGLKNCTNLTNLNLSGCNSLQNVNGLTNLKNLTELDLSDWNGESLQNLKGFSNCTFLTRLNINCRHLENLDGLSSCTNLTSLNMSGSWYCDSLQNVNGIAGLVNLTQLNLSTCRSLRPKPSPDIMTTRSQVKAYQVKVMKKAGMEIPESFGDAIPSEKSDKPSIERKTLAKIKKFLKSRDYSHIDSGIELIRSMNDPSIYEVLLDACSIDNEGKFVKNSLFTGNGLEQPYLDYALLNLIAYAPEDSNLDESLKRSNIESLSLVYSNEYSLQNIGVLANYKNLTNLSLDVGSLENLDVLTSLTKLTSLHIEVGFKKRFADNSVENVDALTSLTKLTKLFVDYRYFPVIPKNRGMITRKQVEEYQDKIRLVMALRDGDTDVLKDYKKNTNLDLSGCHSLQNVDGLVNCTKLTSLNLNNCKDLQNVDGLASLTKLTNLDLGSCEALQNIDGLANCTNLTNLDLGSCEALQNVDGLANCTKLTVLNLHSCDSLKNVDGLANCTNLTKLDPSFCNSLQNVDGLANCTKLTNIDLYYCRGLKNVDGLTNLTNITTLALKDCESLKNLDGLVNCTEIASLDLRGCYSLQNVNGLVGCTSLKSLNLRTCGVVPTPTPVVMKNRRQVAIYQEKIKNYMK